MRVDRSHAVGAMAADDGEVGHAHLLDRRFLDHAHAHHALVIPREAHPRFIQEATVDLIDDRQVSGQKHFKESHRPLFQRFRQERVIGVG